MPPPFRTIRRSTRTAVTRADLDSMSFRSCLHAALFTGACVRNRDGEIHIRYYGIGKDGILDGASVDRVQKENGGTKPEQRAGGFTQTYCITVSSRFWSTPRAHHAGIRMLYPDAIPTYVHPCMMYAHLDAFQILETGERRLPSFITLNFPMCLVKWIFFFHFALPKFS